MKLCIAGIFALLFGRLLGARKGALASILGIGLYTLLVSASASVVRAANRAGFLLRSGDACRVVFYSSPKF